MTDLPPSWAQLRDLVGRLPPPGPPKSVRVSKRAGDALRRASRPAEPPGHPGVIPGLFGVPVIPDADLPAGAWEIRAGDQVISRGLIRSRMTGALGTPHPIEACYGSRLHCVTHDADEPDGGYRACLECRHVFRTDLELLAEHNRITREYDPGRPAETNPDAVFCCPHCTHSW